MAWWSWLLIWGILVLALIGMLVWSGISLFRKFVAVTSALGELLDKLDVLQARADELSEEAFAPAIFADPDELSFQRQERIAQRLLERQIRRDSRVKRGKLLIRADARQFSYLVKRS
jgi:hypothetical protein